MRQASPRAARSKERGRIDAEQPSIGDRIEIDLVVLKRKLIGLGILSKYGPRRLKRAPVRFDIRVAGLSSVLVTLLCPPAAKFGGS